MKAIKFMIPVALFAATAFVSTSARGQVAVGGPASKSVVDDANKVEETKKSWISGSVGNVLTNEYIFNGLVQDKDTLIAEPYLNLSFSLYDGEGFLSAVSFEVPLWWSIHDINKPETLTGNRNSLRPWYEFDVTPGFCFTFGKKWSFTVSDYIYTSPGDYFDVSHNLNLALTYNDSELLGAFALSPHFHFMQELDGHSGLAVQGDTLGQFYEFGIAPGHIFAEKSTYPVTLAFPTAVGFGTNGYYGQGFGFFSTAASVSLPLAFIPEAHGKWTTSVTGQYFRLGTNSARFTDNPNNTATGRRNQIVIAWSVGTEF